MHINKHTTKHAPTCTPKHTAIGQRKQGIIAPLLRSILAGGALLCLVSCNDMDTSPSSTYPEDQFWTSIEKAQYMLNMVYNQHYSAGTMWSDETLTDNLIHARDFSNERTIRDGNAETTTTIFATTWKNLYAGIKTANMFLENIDKLQANQHTLTRMKAQARYLRAWMYLRLTSLYGDVPYFTTNLTSAEAKRVSRTPHTQVMTAIHNELTAIVNYLPRRDDLTDDERGQITRGAAIMLQARAYLYDADWAAVEQYCLMLMNEQEQYGHYALYPNYQDLFSQDAEYNAEIIADYEYAPRVKTWGEMHDMAPISVGARVNGRAPTESLVSAYLMEDGLTTDVSPLYNAEHPYAHRDPRLTATVVYDGYRWSDNVPDGTTGKIIYTHPNSNITTDAYAGPNKNQTPTGYYVRKYYDAKHEDRLSSSINIITMRYADVLLMYAEAMNEQGKMSQEVWNATLRPIRQRAGFTLASALDYPATATQADMRDIIRRERRCELALEGLRWFDIKRWRIGKQCLDGYVLGARFINNNTENIRLDKYIFDENRDYLWSVPQTQMDINPNLMPNNPGYSR